MAGGAGGLAEADEKDQQSNRGDGERSPEGEFLFLRIERFRFGDAQERDQRQQPDGGAQPQSQPVWGGAIEAAADQACEKARQEPGKRDADEGSQAAEDAAHGIGAVAVFVGGQAHQGRRQVDAEQRVAARHDHCGEDGPVVAREGGNRFGQRQHPHADNRHQDAEPHCAGHAQAGSERAAGQAQHHVAEGAGGVELPQKYGAVAQTQNVEGFQEHLDAEKTDGEQANRNQQQIDIATKARACSPQGQKSGHVGTVSAVN